MKGNLEALKSKDSLLKNSADPFLEKDRMSDKNQMEILKSKYNGFLPTEKMFKPTTTNIQI